jgi:hypothetical protein
LPPSVMGAVEARRRSNRFTSMDRQVRHGSTNTVAKQASKSPIMQEDTRRRSARSRAKAVGLRNESVVSPLMQPDKRRRHKVTIQNGSRNPCYATGVNICEVKLSCLILIRRDHYPQRSDDGAHMSNVVMRSRGSNGEWTPSLEMSREITFRDRGGGWCFAVLRPVRQGIRICSVAMNLDVGVG